MTNEDGLNPRQKAFVDAYCQCPNATQAAIKAGYAPKTARAAGSRLLTIKNVNAAISTRMRELQDKSIADTKEILQYMTSVMRGEQSDIVVMNIGKGAGVTAAEKVSTKVAEKERLKAAEMLAKVNGLFRQELELSGALPIVICDDI